MQESLQRLYLKLQQHLLALGSSYLLATSRWKEDANVFLIPWEKVETKRLLCYATESESLDLLKKELQQFIFPTSSVPDYAIVLLQHSFSPKDANQFLKHFSIPTLLVETQEEKFMGSKLLVKYVEPLFLESAKESLPPPDFGPSEDALFWEEFLYGARLHLKTPYPWATGIFLIVISLIFLAQFFSRVQPPQDAQVALRLGALFGPYWIAFNEDWRHLSAPFVHLGLLHFLMNALSLLYLGRFTERLYKTSSWILLSAGCGIVASCASLFFEPFVMIAGSSGILFGCLGSLIALLCIERKRMPRSLQKKLWNAVFWIVALNFGLAFLLTGLAHTSHLAGLFTGFFGGLTFAPKNLSQKTNAQMLKSALFLLGICLVWVATKYQVQQQVIKTKKHWNTSNQTLYEIHQYLEKELFGDAVVLSGEKKQQLHLFLEKIKTIELELTTTSIAPELQKIIQVYVATVKQTLESLQENKYLLKEFFYQAQQNYRWSYALYESLVLRWMSRLS